MIPTSKTRAIIPAALILVAALLLITPMFIHGVPSGNDLPQHFQFALSYRSSFAAGIPDPGWSADTNHGYGDVGVRFYPPLAYYVLNALRTISGNWHDATILSIGFWFVLGGIGVYILAREWFESTPSVAASITYLLLPYHVNQIYNAFFYAEFAAAGIIPYCFFFVTRLVRNCSPANVLGLAAAYSLLLLAHLPTALIGSIALLVYAIFSLTEKGRLRALVSLAAGASLGVAAASFYLLRVVIELRWLKHASSGFASSAYDFKNNFLFGYFFVGAENYWDRNLWFGDAMLLITALLACSAAIIYYLRGHGETTRSLRPMIALLALGIFFATPLSVPIWERAEVLRSIQFPFRWMSMVTLAGAVIVASGVAAIRTTFATSLRPAAIVFLGLGAIAFVFSVNQVIRPAIHLNRAVFNTNIAALNSAPSCECWLPVWASIPASDDSVIGTDVRTVRAIDRNPHLRSFEVDAGLATSVPLATFYYPHWNAKIAGKDAKVEKNQDGVIVIDVPENASKIELSFDEPNYVHLSRIISALAWLVIVGGFSVMPVISKRNFFREVQIEQ